MEGMSEEEEFSELAGQGQLFGGESVSFVSKISAHFDDVFG